MASEDTNIDIPELAPFDPTKKKKKKKVTDENVEPLADTMESMTVSDGPDTSFAGLKKKKKKPVDPNMFDDDVGEGGEVIDGDIGEDGHGDESDEVQLPQFPWEGADRNYVYEELLGRVFNILRENNPELAGDRRRTVMRPPQVMREGTKKTVFANFTDLCKIDSTVFTNFTDRCKMMHRQPDHVMSFLLSELGTSGSLDGQQRLVVKGRFAPKNFEGILRTYANEYVICSGCKSSDTILFKENRLFFLRCEQCGSARSVAPVTHGFVARVGRRSA